MDGHADRRALHLTATAISVVLGHPHAPTRTGLRKTLEPSGFHVLAEIDDAPGALDAVAEHQPALAVLSLALPGGALTTARRLGVTSPATRIVVLGADPAAGDFVDAVRAGALGYLEEGMAVARLPDALRSVLEGEAAYPRRLLPRLAAALRERDELRALVDERSTEPLTDRQWEVLRLLVTGRTAGAIALELGISQGTVRRHAADVVSRLGYTNRSEAVRALRDLMAG